MECNKCGICKYTSFDYIPKGTDKPEVYFVSEAMSSEDNQSGNIFTSSGHKLLIDMLDSFGINMNNARFAHIIRCYPQVSDEDTSYRKPTQEEIDNCKEYLIEDIVNCQPKLIVTLGGLVSKEFVGDEFTNITNCHGNLYHKPLEDPNLPFGNNGQFNIMPMYHPSYVERRVGDMKVRLDYKKDIQKILQICSGSNLLYDNYDDKRDYEDETVICKSYEDFDNFCKKEIDSSDRVSYDIETNAEEKTSSRYDVVGFSLASRKVVGCYVVNDSLDYKMPDIDRKRIEARLRKILLNKKVYTYNCMHELPATLNWLGIEIPDIEDLFVMVKLLMGNAGQYEGNGGLKIQCQMNLNCKDWSEDLDTYFTYLRDFYNKKSAMKVLMSKYYNNDELDDIMIKIEKAYEDENTFKNNVISYGLVPHKLIGKYGGIDSSILFDLLKFYEDKMDNYNKEMGIDLYKGYKYWMMHHIAGYTLERNGAFWNEDVARDVENWCNDGMNEALKNLVISDLSERAIQEKLEYDFLLYLKDNYLTDILGNMAVPKRLYKNSVHIVLNTNLPHNELEEKLKKMSVYPNDKGILKLELQHLGTLYKEFCGNKETLFSEWYKNYMDDFRSKEHSHDEMKALINPRAVSKEFKDFISSILITDKIIYAKFYDNLIKYMESPKFSMDDYEAFGSNDRFVNDRKLLQLIQKLNLDENIPKPRKLDVVIKFLDNLQGSFMSYNIKNRLQSAMDYKLDSLDDDHILELYDLYVLCGLNIEDRDSWSKEFEWLYNFRVYKKYAKILSTYINGKVGRNNVWYVDKESYTNGDLLTRRDIKYHEEIDHTKDNAESSDKVLMYQSSFLVDMADTGRWKSGFHTLPAGDTIKNIYTSRFKGGIIAMPDCSQAEVRVLAAQCQEENLMKAFKDGLDIHRYVAAMVFHQGNQDEVTSTERKIAKGAVFGILYGESEKSFADSFCHGDLNEAKKIFDYFFTAFPKIKNYVEESHEQFNKYQKVTLMTDRFLNLESQIQMNGGDQDRVLRQAQNFRIQGATCDIAGMILYQICDFIKKNNMKSKPFCFIHDSIEIDIHPDETFIMLDKLKPLFNNYPWDTFGVPMASDIVFSAGMGAEIEVDDLIHDDEYNDVTISLKGFEDDIEKVETLWKSVYKVVDLISSEDKEEIYLPYSGLFQKKVTMSKMIGKSRKEVSRKYHVIRK